MNLDRGNRTKKIVVISLIGGIYLILTLVFSLLSFTPVQLRVAEILTILPAVSILGVWGVTFGCFFSNFVGYLMGVTMFLDIIFGTLATFVAAVLSYKLRKFKIKGLPLLSSFMPVIVNGLIIGPMLYFLTFEGSSVKILFFYIITVSVGQILPCMVLGPLLYYFLEKTSLDKLFINL